MDIFPGAEAVASVGAMGEAVLLVEQEAPTREHLSRQLADDGFEVLAAGRAVAALALVESERPDLVLLDAVLPDASGFEVCGRLRAGEPGRAWNRDVPVIMVTARGDPSDRVRGFARGADDYVVVPSSTRSWSPACAPSSDAPRGPAIRGWPSVISRSTSPRASSASPARPFSSPRRSSTSSSPSPRTPTACTAKRSSCVMSGASARWGVRGRSTRTRAAFAASSTWRAEAGYVVNVWGVGYRLIAAT